MRCEGSLEMSKRITGAILCSMLLFTAATATAQQATLTTHVPEAVASGTALLVGHIPAGQRLSLAISLPLRNHDDLEALLQRIYDRQSPDYHKYLSVEEFTERFGPAEADFSAVAKFSKEHDFAVLDTPANRMVLDVEADAATIEKALHVTLGLYQHPTENRTFYAPDREPTLDLDEPILHISGLDNFSPMRPKYVESGVRSNTTGSGPGGSFLGSDLRTAYYGSGPLNGGGQSVGLFEGAGYEMSDIQLYFSSVNQSLNVPVVGVSVNGANLGCVSPCSDVEQSLDIEQAISMAPGLSSLRVYVGKTNVSIINQMAADNLSKTLSCSWGWADNESSIDPLFEEMAAQGQTFFVATGDNGSGTPANVVWPSDDPNVTAVGGTVLVTNGAGGAWKSETGWVNSAGMPSPNGVPIPSYQQFAGVITTTNGGSKTLRNIPDVASESNASQYVCAEGKCQTQGGGTSYAAPLWASLIAMVNEQALANGGTYAGFINTELYEIGVGKKFSADFHDIIKGSNGAYTAVKGYDLVTGWGSPKGLNLIDTMAP